MKKTEDRSDKDNELQNDRNFSTTWLQTFVQVIDDVHADLAVVLHAWGCRERWLQAEFYRRLIGRDANFSVDTFPISRYSKADLYGELFGPMVGEIKVFGTSGYYNKNVAGKSNIAEWLPKNDGDRIVVTKANLDAVNENEGSLLKDFKRLQNVSEEFQRFLILILHKNGPTDDLGRAMRAVKFSCVEYSQEYAAFHLRIWQL